MLRGEMKWIARVCSMRLGRSRFPLPETLPYVREVFRSRGVTLHRFGAALTAARTQ